MRVLTMLGRMTVLWLGVLLLAGASCQPTPRGGGPAPGADGVTYLVRIESAPGVFLKTGPSGITTGPQDADAAFVLFDLDRGALRSGDEVLLLSARDGYLKGGAPGASLTEQSSGPSTPGSGQIGFCNVALVVERADGVVAGLEDRARVRLRVFADPCNPPSSRSAGAFVSVAAGSSPAIVAGPPSAAETFTLHLDHGHPYRVARGLSAPFANPARFNAGNLMDLDWHSGAQRDYLGGSPPRTYDGHTGVDFGWPWPGFRAMEEGGAAVLAVAAGTVVYVRDDRGDRCHGGEPPGMGCPPDVPHDTDKAENEVVLRHDDGTASVYAHLMKGSVPVREGQRVACGQLIGRVGSSGGSSGPHLHFELRWPHDPAFWSRNPGSLRFPHFWDHSMVVDAYETGAWQQLSRAAPWMPPATDAIPLVTCRSGETQRLAREGEDVYQRSLLARGFQFDGCTNDDGESVQHRCGENYFCGARGYCERRAAAGDPCTSGNQCPPGHGCRNGRCAPGPNCSDACPVAPHPANCFIDADGKCMNEAPGLVRESCATVGGRCVPPCFVDGAGDCRVERPGIVRRSCALQCLP